VGDLAVLADAAQEALGADAEERGGNVERLHAHFAEAADGGRRIVGVKGGNQQVAGEGRFDGDAGGFLIADFADENNVGVHAQITAQGAGEGETDLPVHLHLVEAGQGVFDRVFGGLDVDLGIVD